MNVTQVNQWSNPLEHMTPRAYELQPPAALATEPTLRRSQRTIKTPVRYADQFP